MLIANVQAGADPAVSNPIVMRQTYTTQHIVEIPGRGAETIPNSGSTPGTATRIGMVTFDGTNIPVASISTITVATAVSVDPPSWVEIGEYRLTTDQDFVVVNADTATTATNLATAINNLPGYVAAGPAGSVITFNGPVGLEGRDILFESGGFNSAMFTLSPTNGRLGATPAEPHIGPPVIT
jgi:hypothetical protein